MKAKFSSTKSLMRGQRDAPSVWSKVHHADAGGHVPDDRRVSGWDGVNLGW